MKLLRTPSVAKRYIKALTYGSSNTFPLPTKYPCFVYDTVLSFGYEEVQPNYLYREDLEKMLLKLQPPTTNVGED